MKASPFTPLQFNTFCHLIQGTGIPWDFPDPSCTGTVNMQNEQAVIKPPISLSLSASRPGAGRKGEQMIWTISWWWVIRPALTIRAKTRLLVFNLSTQGSSVFSLPLSQEIRNSSISQSGFPYNCLSTVCSPSAVSTGSSGKHSVFAILLAPPGNGLKYTGHHTCRSPALKIYSKQEKPLCPELYGLQLKQ